MKKSILFFILLFCFSCQKNDSTDIPTYIRINTIDFEGEATTNITDAWVYINDNLQGVYELPAEFPVLESGQQNIRIKAGIKKNGIAATRTTYPFYKSYLINQLDFDTEEIIEINASVNYLDNINFWSEDFEGIGVNIESTIDSDISYVRNFESNNEYCSGILLDSLITYEIATEELFNLPQEGANVYLELDYRCNTRFLVGMFANFPQSSVLQKDIMWLYPKNDWNKIYIDLTSSISESVGAESFKIFFGMKRDFSIDENIVDLDNIKIVY